MAFARISSKLPSNHPSYCPIVSVTDTATHSIKSVASGSSAAVLSIPASAADVDGRRFTIYLAGRIKLYSGATPGTFAPGISQGNPIVQNLLNPSFTLPANASGVLLPFNLRLQCAYDAQAQQLYAITDFFMGNATNNGRQSPLAGAPYSSAVPPNNLAFQALYAFSVAPLSGTTVEILELVVG